MNKLIINPFFYYIIFFTLAFFLYDLRWSDIFIDKSLELSLFIFSTVFFAIFFIFVVNNFISKNRDLNVDEVSKYKVKIILYFLIFGALLEYAYHGLIPIYYVSRGIYYDYTQFGIPVFHVFFLSYVTLLGVVYGYRFLIYKKKYYLLIYGFSILFSISIINRGTLMFIIMASVIAYCSVNFRIKKLLKTILVGFLVILLFGFLGNLRMSSSGYTEEDAILKVGQASHNFHKTSLPSELFWGYLYLTSPYANLEYEVQQRKFNHSLNYKSFFNYEILPDFISKRVNVGNTTSNLIVDELNVSTMYAGSINKLGFLGGIILFFWYSISSIITLKLVQANYFKLTLILLSTLSCFLVFDNVLRFSGFVFQFFILICFSHFKFKQLSIL